MYVNPVLVGVFGTILCEVVACVLWAIWDNRKK